MVVTFQSREPNNVRSGFDISLYGGDFESRYTLFYTLTRSYILTKVVHMVMRFTLVYAINNNNEMLMYIFNI